MTHRLIIHGRITQRLLKTQVLLLRIVNPETRVLFDPDLPNNTVMIEEEDDDDDA